MRLGWILELRRLQMTGIWAQGFEGATSRRRSTGEGTNTSPVVCLKPLVCLYGIEGVLAMVWMEVFTKLVFFVSLIPRVYGLRWSFRGIFLL